MTPQLSDWIEKGRGSVMADPNHVFMPYFRQHILYLFGAPAKGSTPLTDEGHRRRALVAIECARKTLPFWDRLWPRVLAPHRALDLSEGLVNGQKDTGDYERVLSECMTAADLHTVDDRVAWRVGECAAAALTTTLYDQFLIPEAFSPDTPDIQLDGDDSDASSLAAMIFGGGHVESPLSNKVGRLEFWIWWLNEAVPRAFDEGTLLSK